MIEAFSHSVSAISYGQGIWVQIENNFDGTETHDWAHISVVDAKKLRDQINLVILEIEPL